MITLILADTQAAAAAAKVKPAKIRSWLHRGYITRHGYDHAGRALVDIEEVQAYADQREPGTRRVDNPPDLL